jgi:hypothetical protein
MSDLELLRKASRSFVLAQIYWYNIHYRNENELMEYLLNHLSSSTELYGVFWVSDANIPYVETRAHVIVATKLLKSGKDAQLRAIEGLCKIQHSDGVVDFANASIVNSGDLDWIVKAIESKPTSGSPKLFGKKIESWESLKAQL